MLAEQEITSETCQSETVNNAVVFISEMDYITIGFGTVVNFLFRYHLYKIKEYRVYFRKVSIFLYKSTRFLLEKSCTFYPNGFPVPIQPL